MASHRATNEPAAAVAIALDIGGTKIAAGLVDDRGGVIQPTTMPTGAAEGGPAVLERSLAVAGQLHAACRDLTAPWWPTTHSLMNKQRRH